MQLIALAVVSSWLGAATPPALDAEDLGPFVDAYVEKELARHHIPGAVVAVVKDGRVVLSRGYGLANVEAKVPVDAGRTRFFVASVTKTFTATAVMQLVERGKLDLDEDVNRSLRAFQVPAAFGRPITLRHLLTHTSGFDVSLLDLGVPEGKEPLPLATHLAAHLPQRVRPPGELFSYSNRNYSLAGHLVEVASGVSFPTYVQREVLAPLGMTHSGFALPADPLHELAVSYHEPDDGPPLAWPTPLMNDTPAGGLLASGDDVAKFMLAHLGGGTPLLEPATLERMHAQAWTFHPALDGMTLGFMEGHALGHRTLVHEGFMAGYLSLMTLVPDLGLGIFVETTGGSLESTLTSGLPAALLERYFPATAPPAAVPTFAAAPSSVDPRLAGTWRSIDHSQRTFEKVGVLAGFSRSAAVTLAPDGGLLVNGRAWSQLEPGVFARPGTDSRIAFRGDAFARGIMVYQRAPWHENLLAHQVFFASALALCLATTLSWPVAAGLRRLRRRPLRPGLRPGERWTVRALALMPLIFLGGIAAACLGPLGPFALFAGLPWWVMALFGLPILMILPALGTAFIAVRAWRQRTGSLFTRLHSSAIALAGLGLVAFFAYWNLLGFRF